MFYRAAVQPKRPSSHKLPVLLCLLWLCVSSLFSPAHTLASELRLLFIGNSYTYYPGTGESPGLPAMIREIATSIDPTLVVTIDSHLVGSSRLEDHYRAERAHELMKMPHDVTFVQGQSVESLELTPGLQSLYAQQGLLNPGVSGFATYLPMLLDELRPNSSAIVLYVNWGWNVSHHGWLQPWNPSTRFPEGHPRAGQRWFGGSQQDFQDQINASYLKHSAGFDVTLAFVGSAWLKVADTGLVSYDDLYVPNDWSHPSVLGSFLAALVLTRDGLKLDISRSTFVPEGIDPGLALRIQTYLATPTPETP